jgi:hypothetical protein
MCSAGNRSNLTLAQLSVLLGIGTRIIRKAMPKVQNLIGGEHEDNIS